jgi:hypothetical protein
MPADADGRAEPAVFPADGARNNDAIPKRIESHLVKAIISTICCCLPFGLVAIVYAAQVGPCLRVNDIGAALEASKKADLWGNLAIGIGIISQALWFGFYKFAFSDAFFELLRANIGG